MREVAPRLVDAGHRVIVPYLRGFGPTRFRAAATLRSGQQAALGHDLLALLDALQIERALLAGYDWGGRAACIVVRAVAAARGRAGLGQRLQRTGHRRRSAPGATADRAPPLVPVLLPRRARARRPGAAPARAVPAAVAAVVAWLVVRRCDLRAQRRRLRQPRLRRGRDPFVPASIRAGRRRSALRADRAARWRRSLRSRCRRSPSTAPTTASCRPWAVPAIDTASPAPHEHRLLAGVGHNPPQEAPAAFAQAVLDVQALR